MRKVRAAVVGVVWCLGALFGGGAQAGSVVDIVAGQFGMFEVEVVLDDRVVARALVDTGAAHTVIMCGAVRSALDLKLGGEVITQTANGYAVKRESVLRSIRVGGIMLDNVTILVGEQQGGCLVLLGISFLKRLSVRIDGDRMTLMAAVVEPAARKKSGVAAKCDTRGDKWMQCLFSK